MDGTLISQDEAVLSAHLRDCSSCRAYATEMMEVEDILSPLMKRQWRLQPIPLSASLLVQRKHSFIVTNTFLAMRRAAVGILVAVFFFSAWNFAQSHAPALNGLPTRALPIPTPSSSSTQAQTTLSDCEVTSYTATEADTLSSLAERFSAAEEEIVALNNLETEAIRPGMELLIPVCRLTPTHTASSGTLTTTSTPRLGSSSSTPSPGW